MAFNPYDLYNQDPNAVYQTAPNVFQGQDPARLAEILRSGSTPQTSSPLSGMDADTFKKLGKAGRSWFDNLGGQALPNSSQNAMTNAITPDFQSGSYGAPTMNMTGAENITPNFGSFNKLPSAPVEQGFNPSMFKGMF